ncbi:MAG: GTPase protein [Phycisphaerales bacterium]|nr:GTPase protein [Phycisphaerales bacterium]
MALREAKLDSSLAGLEKALAGVRGKTSGAVATAVDRWRSDAEAIRFHLRDDGEDRPMLVAILGGTGTGKSTLVNRLLGANLTATSFRRTFTSGAVAITSDEKNLPERWLAIEHRVVSGAEVPARGQVDALAVVKEERELTAKITLVDTPDLDGDQPLHHAQADRVFRWAQAIVFLVTPEKYQMTELLPYYRLAKRYAVPALFVMNKAEEPGVVEDFQKQLAARDWADARAFVIPRDDAAYEPPMEMNLSSLRSAVMTLTRPEKEAFGQGLARRSVDLLGRLQDQIMTPLREDRQQVDALVASVRSLETPGIGVDVNPITQGLQRRLQQRSVLYLMGPQRVLERVRQVPGMMMRMPRTLWDVVVKGQGVRLNDPARGQAAVGPDGRAVPDFKAAVSDQFSVVQSRIEDVLRSSPAGQRWLAGNEESYKQARLEPGAAGQIVADELGELEKWLEERWNATPRDTLLLMRLLRHLPGGEKLSKWTEAAPYLLAVVVATHHAFFGPVDLVVLGGWSLATWLTEKLSNEVAMRTRAANRRIAERFSDLAHTQIGKVSDWLNAQAPTTWELQQLERSAEELYSVVGENS